MPASCGHTSYLTSFREGLRPDPPLWVDEWSEQHMIIPPESGAAEPGRYRVGRTPYARDVMRALSPEHPARKIVVKGASQLLKTQVALNWISSLIDRAPANIIVLEPTDKLARRVATRFDKTAAAVPVLRRKVALKKDRDAKNTGDTKEFKGGTAWFLSARSASNLAEASARYLVVDEVDRLLREIKGEGDPIGLGEKRQTTYGRKAKGLYISSPTEEDSSRINELFEQGNQHLYHVPCPHCGELQPLKWENLQYDLDAGHAWYVCDVNGCMIEEHHKPAMLPDERSGGKASWVPQAAGDGATWSYEISSLYAPLGWVSWLDLAKEHAEAEAALNLGDSEKMQVFYNTRLARTWSAISARLQPEKIKDTAEEYRLGIAPRAALVVTAAVDVQENRLEVQIDGWGFGQAGLEAWIVSTHIIYGHPTSDETWKELDEILKTPVKHASGTLLPIRCACVDSGDGDYTHEVYEFTRQRRRRYLLGEEQVVLAVKGASRPNKPIIAGRPAKVDVNFRGKFVPNGAEVWQIGTDTAKDWLFNRLNKGRGAIHFSNELPLAFYQQLLAETKMTVYSRGRKTKRYQLIKRGERNEQLDLFVYNLAAACYLGLDRYTQQRWERVAARMAQADVFTQDIAPAQSAAIATPPIPSPPVAVPTAPRKTISSNEWSSRL